MTHQDLRNYYGEAMILIMRYRGFFDRYPEDIDCWIAKMDTKLDAVEIVTAAFRLGLLDDYDQQIFVEGECKRVEEVARQRLEAQMEAEA